MIHGEKFNSLTHLFGAVLAAGGATALILLAAHTGNPWKIVSFTIYGAMLLVLYVTSTVYHAVAGRAKPVLQKFDHCAIYLLIAGTYTPFTLVSLHGGWGWSLFGAIWGLAVIGIVQEIWLARGARVASLIIYCLMGWMAVVAIGPLIHALTWHGFIWLIAGGLFYTGGIVFYATDHKVRHGHGIWHLFVLGGSICHYISVLIYVA